MQHDLETHALVSRDSDGPAVTFAAGSYVAVLAARTTSDRANAAVVQYEKLIRQVRLSAVQANASAILLAADGLRVAAFVALRSRATYRYMQAAWAEDHARAHLLGLTGFSTITLYRAAVNLGVTPIDPSSFDAYGVEGFPVAAERLAPMFAPLSSAAGFRGSNVFASDDGSHSLALYCFARRADLATFRASARTIDVFGAERRSEDQFCEARAVKTYA